ncbi:MAG: sugar ABC transporter ATP-binding protein [Actinomycetales bacterium]|nr:sugar ABC transporter ATP-binding protein [Actinomycetales bacterium]
MTASPVELADSPRLALEVRGLSKTFLGQRALDGVDFDLRAGEVHALLGQNGSGKSTLIKCLAGYHEPDPGAELEIAGRAVPLPYQPGQATQMGLVFVHQDLGLVPNLSVAENFAISRRYDARSLGRIRWNSIQARAARELESLGHDIDPRGMVGRLSLAEQTLVAIARALASAENGARVLVLDEPTAALPDARRGASQGSRSEVELLFEAVRSVVASGVGVIYVSHKLHEILDLADRATVLRDGRKVSTFGVPGMSEADLVRSIVGRDVVKVTRDRSQDRPAGDPLLKVSGLSGNMVRDVSFAIDRGEIVGVAGMLGSGRSELGRLLFGAQPPTAGSIELRGAPADFRDPRGAVRNGVALIPEDRRREGGVLNMTVGRNLTLPSIGGFFHKGRIQNAAVRKRAKELITEFHISPPVPSRKFGVLSGGNQQKVVVAKWLGTSPDLVIFDEPVQGVDVGARAEIYQLVSQSASRGAGVLLISSEFDQMLEFCTRVLVMRDGRLVADLPTESITPHMLTQYVYFGGAVSSEKAQAAARPVQDVELR